MKTTLITTTRGRALCFAMLEKIIARQTVQPDQWLVISDDSKGYQFTRGQQVIKRNNKKDKLHSLLENWLAVIPHIEHEKILVAEDDDWYNPTYIETMSALLERYSLAGVKHDLYYKLPLRKYVHMGNCNHASLAASGFTKEMLPFIERCRRHKSIYIDCYLWGEATQAIKLWTLIPNKAEDGRAYHVGMKLMPGQSGIGQGHTETGCADHDLSTLRSWIGEDVRMYQTIPKSAWDVNV